jgi:hypothetical protein
MQVHILIGIASAHSLRAGFWRKAFPNFLVSLTTSVGFGGLMTSHVPAVAQMGAYMALGIWIIFFWSHLTHWGLTALWRPRIQPVRLDWLANLTDSPRYASLIRARWVAFAAFLVIVAGAWALVRNPTETNGVRYFGRDHPARVATEYLQDHVTGGTHVDLLIPRTGLDATDLDALERRLAGNVATRHLLSARAFGHMLASLAADALDAGSDEELLERMHPDLARRYRSADFERIQILVDDMDLAAYRRFAADLDDALASVGLAESALVTGPLPQVTKVQQYLLSSLARSLSLTIGLVVILMFLMMGRKARPDIVLAPNLFPLACMAIAMWLFGAPTSISVIMAFSVAFGVAVDDTIHLFHTFFDDAHGDFNQRWRAALRRDARAIFLSTVTLTSGFMVLLLSDFSPTRHFGLLLGVGMVFALIGDVFVLPILLRWRYRESSGGDRAANSPGSP